jgi:peptide alpha-N-acetyltransferase
MKNDVHGGPLGDLLEMQCIWYITEDGESYLRQGNFGLALKRFQTIWKVFDDWTEDQFDFHSFSLRKGQIRSYIEMLRWEDSLRAHPFFARAALGAIKAYIMLYDKPHLAHSSLSNGNREGLDFEGLSVADRKKALKRAKREQQKLQEKAAEVAARSKEDKAKNAQVASLDGEAKKEDTDPFGNHLAQTKEPLEAAMKFLAPLLELSPKRFEVQCAGFEVYLRRRKWLLALKCLIAARELEKDNPVTHEQAVRLRRAGLSPLIYV